MKPHRGTPSLLLPTFLTMAKQDCFLIDLSLLNSLQEALYREMGLDTTTYIYNRRPLVRAKAADLRTLQDEKTAIQCHVTKSEAHKVRFD